MLKQIEKFTKFDFLLGAITVFLAVNCTLNYEIQHTNFWISNLSYAVVVLLAGYAFRYIFRLLGNFSDYIFAFCITVYLYKIWPHTYFDDAGFIMRYLDNLQQGVWFHFNAGESPVYGISGFVHGLYCSLLVKVLGMTPERSLHISNLTGLFFSAVFLLRIIRKLLPELKFEYILVSIALLYSKYFCDVYFQGMETPLHIAIVLAALHFMLQNKWKWFYGFSALAVISKLEAVPVVVVMFIIHKLPNLTREKFTPFVKTNLLSFFTCFVLPMLVWITFSTWFFGSPMPQSAKAKMLYHSGAIQSNFPFLEVFLQDSFRLPLLILLLVFFIIQLFFVRNVAGDSILKHFAFGWMFVGLMVLFHFYNPNERMLWYYAFPDLLLVLQCLFSVAWIISKVPQKSNQARISVLTVAFVFFLKADTDGARYWMFSYLERVEQERFEVGKYVAQKATPSDTLLAWHGLTSRPFPGFVIDGTGLNSKLALSYKLNRDSLINEFHPRLIIHHAQDYLVECFSSHHYRILDVYGDVTLENYEPWVLWERPANLQDKNQVNVLRKEDVKKGEIAEGIGFLKISGDEIQLESQIRDMQFKKLWFVFEGRDEKEREFMLEIFENDSLVDSHKLTVKSKERTTSPSLYTQSFSINLENIECSGNEVVFKFSCFDENDMLKISCPMLEFTPKLEP